MARLWSPKIKNDPLAFVMFAFPWGQEGTPLAKFTGPRRWQRDILAQLRDHIQGNDGKIDFEMFRKVVSSGRGIGKSALVSCLCKYRMALCRMIRSFLRLVIASKLLLATLNHFFLALFLAVREPRLGIATIIATVIPFLPFLPLLPFSSFSSCIQFLPPLHSPPLHLGQDFIPFISSPF